MLSIFSYGQCYRGTYGTFTGQNTFLFFSNLTIFGFWGIFVSCNFSGLSAGFLLHSDAAVSGGEGGAALSPVQSLAVTGLNMLSQNRPEAAASSRNKR